MAEGEGAPARERSLEALAEPSEEFEEIAVDAPLVGIVMGSKSDLPAMEAAEKELQDRGIRVQVVMSVVVVWIIM